MRGRRVSVGFTKNLGNYQSLRVEVTLERDNSNDTVDSMIETAAAFVYDALDTPLSERGIQLLDHFRQEERDRVQISKEHRSGR